MAIAKISIWLNDPRRDYTYGVLLYDQFGLSDLLKVLFKNGNSQYHQDRLFDELEKLNPNLEELTNKSSFKIPELKDMPIPVKKYGVTDEVWDKLPEQIKDLYTTNSKLHRHAQLLFDQARIATNDQDRRLLGSDILKERNQLNANWKAIKDYHEQGKLREEIRQQGEKSVDEMSIWELIMQFKNIPSSLSKDKKYVLDLPDGSKKNQVLLRIQEREVQLEMVKKRLEGMK
jgi:hypothetical protein